CIDPLNSNSVVFEKYISNVTFRKGYPDFSITNGGIVDLNKDGYKEIIFMISGGFSLKPRAIFAYDIKNDSLLESNYEYAFFKKKVRNKLAYEI
ncbi:hypothetical protein ACFL6I_28810, partial [candidate division KSB1 bacterium]